MAQARWRHPAGHVLPVMAVPTPKDDIPPYLRAVTLLDPPGDLVAETVAEVESLERRSRWRRSVPVVAAGVGVIAALAIAGAWWERGRVVDAETARTIAAARELCESGNHAIAWQQFQEAFARRPDAAHLRTARDDCAMRWLRDLRLVGGKESFGDVVNRVLPVLADAAAGSHGQRAADLRAHMGWAEFLRSRDDGAPLDPTVHYRRALQSERGNVYAHAMWGHYVMVLRGPIAEAREHLAAALAAGRDRPFLRRLQLSAMLFHLEPPGEAEALRVANEMRLAGETVDSGMRERLWTYAYHDALVNHPGGDGLRVALREPGSAATFRWLYPESQVRPANATLWRFMLASIEEAEGERESARKRFLELRDQFVREGSSGPMADQTLAAIQRLAPRP